MELHASGADKDKRDFFHYLLTAVDPATGRGFDKPELWGEANVLMIAGSDTTSTGLAATLYYLLRTPEKMEKLKREVRGCFGDVSEIVSGRKMGECRYLRAVIDEALRLCPPVPALLPREVVAPQGLLLECAGERYFLPMGTVVGVPIYAIHHNPAYFPSPWEFSPERWIVGDGVEEGLVERAREAYTPFSIGSRGCIGKSLALMEMRLVVARLVWEWEVEEVEGVSGKGREWREGYRWMGGVRGGRGGEGRWDEFRVRDGFTSRKEGPVVRLRRRVV